MFLAPLLVASCLTPDFQFGDRPKPGGGEGGSVTSEHCSNRTKDADETDTDCGGIDCDPCALGRACEASGDCVNDSCIQGRCQEATCTDGVKNLAETDVDCGGTACGPCADEKKCERPADCESGVCSGGSCRTPSCSDRVKNQGEADVDCAGPCEPCDVGGVCMNADDCAPPPVGDSATVLCNAEGRCELSCALGTGDCNSRASDGCETNTNTSVDHCGACGEVCSPANALGGTCNGGACEIDFSPDKGCRVGYADCDGDPENGCEINLNTNAAHCGACNDACSDANGTPSCSGGNCAIACSTGFSNCDGQARGNGCEIDARTDTKNCGTCGEVCPAGSGESPFCADSECGTTDCPSGFGDCDGNTSCTDSLNTAANCGSCGNTCSVANGTPACSGGTTCAVGSCSGVYANCNGSYADGCEVNTQTSVTHCGGCAGSGGTNCTSLRNNPALHIAAITCSSGGCVISGCELNYADCDGSATNGCEVNILSNDARCGGCLAADARPASGVNCLAAYPNGVGNCNAGTCELAGCGSNFGNCDGIDGNGCEVNIASNPSHCGGCNVACQINSATSSTACSNRLCVPQCNGSGAQCDGNLVNGCENVQTSASHCGGCGNVCATDSVTSSNSCSSGSCTPVCTGAGAVCDGSGLNGCEDRNNDSTNCGACGVVCSTNVGTTANSCNGSGTCVPTCATNYLSCDGNAANGCEVLRTTNATHCGVCGVRCGGDSQTNVQAASCSASTCNVTCSGSFCPDTSNPERPCTVPLGTAQNCTACGQACTGGTPYCTPSGCSAYLPISVVNDTTTQATSSADFTISHVLQTSRATSPYRAVVLVLGNTSNTRDPESVPTYDGAAMTLALDRDSGNQSWVGVYYILDAALPANGKTATISIDGNNFNGQDWTARVIELRNVDQSTALAGTNSSGAGGSSCGNAGNLSVATSAGSFVLSALVEQTMTATATPTDGQTAWPALVRNDTAMTHGYLSNVAAGTRLVRWACTDSEWAHVLAAFHPEGNGP